MFNYWCIEAFYNEDKSAAFGQKVTLPCKGVTNNSSLLWLYRQDKLSNSQLIVSAKGDETVVLQPSGRFAINRTSFSLVIYEVQPTDSGFYGCASNNSYRITRLFVQREYLLSYFYRALY